jgi:hypothetical protein
MECGLSSGQGLTPRWFAGFGFGGGSAPAVVDVCVATHIGYERGCCPVRLASRLPEEGQWGT